MEAIPWRRGQRKWECCRGSQRGQSIEEYGQARNERDRSRRGVSTRRAGSQDWRRKKAAGSDRSDLVSRPEELARSQRGSHELGPMDQQILIASGQGASRTGTSHQKIGSGRASASAEVFLTSQQEDD